MNDAENSATCQSAITLKEKQIMAEAAAKVSVKSEGKSATAPAARRGLSPWQPFESLRQEIDHLFDDVTRGFGGFPSYRRLMNIEPFWPRESTSSMAPAVDVAEKEKEYQVTAELPGIDESNVEVTLVDDVLTIKGEKQEEKEERDKNYHLSERRYGSFQRSFQLPPGVDQSKIEASFRNGVLTIVLPKAPEAQAKTKKIAIKAS
jgi:HSP20 family protein